MGPAFLPRRARLSLPPLHEPGTPMRPTRRHVSPVKPVGVLLVNRCSGLGLLRGFVCLDNRYGDPASIRHREAVAAGPFADGR